MTKSVLRRAMLGASASLFGSLLALGAAAQTQTIVVSGVDSDGRPYTRTIEVQSQQSSSATSSISSQSLSFGSLPAGAKLVDPSLYSGNSSASSASSSSSRSSSSATASRPIGANFRLSRLPARKPNLSVPYTRRETVASQANNAASSRSSSSSSITNNGDRPPQFVLLAFDGSKSLDMWRRTREFARNQNIKFTYFISGVYFLQNKDAAKYKGPGKKRGRSDIGFGGTREEVKERLAQVRAAVNEGHEIGSHLNGHFNGKSWSYEQWSNEMSQFNTLLRDAYQNNGLSEPSDWRSLVKNRMNKGIRAPLLGVNSSFNAAARSYGYRYDTSRTNSMSYWPKKQNGVWNFPLASIPMAGRGGTVLSMDYNFFVRQSGGRNRSSERQKFEDEMYESYMKYFRNNYHGNRAPLHIGHHFSLWNGGAYWGGMKRFARTVCGKPEVKCVTYDEFRKYLENQSSSKINAYRNGSFKKYPRG